MFNLSKKSEKSAKPLNKVLYEIQNGNTVLKETFIEDYKPFVLKCVSKSARKYIDTNNSEEYSIGLIAFNEAIESFNIYENAHFLTFAELVIDRRIKNYLKKESKHAKVVSLSSFGTGFEQMHSIIENDSIIVHFERFETRSEIELFKESLKDFGIEMQDLLQVAPKHTDARITCIKIARLIIENDEMYQKLINKKVLPVKEILTKFNVSERTLERNRKYIIASCVVLKSGLDIVKGFLLELEGREKQ